jgi:hypothetical protein
MRRGVAAQSRGRDTRRRPSDPGEKRGRDGRGAAGPGDRCRRQYWSRLYHSDAAHRWPRVGWRAIGRHRGCCRQYRRQGAERTAEWSPDGLAASQLPAIAPRVAPNAVVTLGGCEVGSGPKGDFLLKAVSVALDGIAVQAAPASQCSFMGPSGNVKRCVNGVVTSLGELSAWPGPAAPAFGGTASGAGGVSFVSSGSVDAVSCPSLGCVADLALDNRRVDLTRQLLLHRCGERWIVLTSERKSAGPADHLIGIGL